MSAKKEINSHTPTTATATTTSGNKRSKSLFSWLSSHSNQSNQVPESPSTPTSAKSPKIKTTERFSFTQVTQHIENDPLLLRKSLEEGLKILMRVNTKSKNIFGFDNSIMWLKGKTLEIWKPSSGENIVIPFCDILSIRVNREEDLLLIKVKNDLEYGFKISDQIKLQQLSLHLKAATAQTLVSEPVVNSSSSSSSASASTSTLPQHQTDDDNHKEDDTSNNENNDANSHSMELSRKKIASTTQRLSLRVPNLTSPGCANERAGARQRLRSRSNSVTALTTPITTTSTTTTTSTSTLTTPTPSKLKIDVNDDQAVSEDLYETLETSKQSPKRTRGELEEEENNENESNNSNLKKIVVAKTSTLSSSPMKSHHRPKGSPSKRSKAVPDCDVIVSNETISL